jgi:beta-lactamase class D
MRLVARLIALTALMAWAAGAAAADHVRADWSRLFEDAGATGTLLVVDERVVDERDGKRHVHDDVRARRRFVPASTFKIPHLLFALDAGIATDASQTFRWDGEQRRFAHWNRD